MVDSCGAGVTGCLDESQARYAVVQLPLAAVAGYGLIAVV